MWDGHNFKQEVQSDDYEEIEYDPDTECSLDEWDGSNFTNGSIGRHTDYAILDDGRYLMIYRSQWEGEHTSAEIISEDAFNKINK